ncbi:MAG: site-2 protease family protein [Pyrinomonadaceae bacterium]|nr:site-2 protease family protein [Pyrinomonadaceae bacterium]
MRSNFLLGRVKGIEIGVHYSWLIIAVLIVLSLASYFRETHVEWGGTVIWLMAVAAALLFFVSIIVHELSHALVAMQSGLPVSSITLFALGGVAQIEKEADNARTEFWLGIIGPITSALIGAFCLATAVIAGWEFGGTPETPLIAILVWLGGINIGLAIFNMVPGFPMDGGRVMKAVIWRLTGNESRAKRWASIIGQMIAVGFIVLGLLAFFSGAGFGGLWIAFIGWFLLNSARASYVQSDMADRLRNVFVRDLMSRDCASVDIRTNLQGLVDEEMLRTGQRCFIVTDGTGPVGLITPNEVRGVERPMWPMKTAADVMRPFETLHTTTPERPALEALEIMGREDVNQLPVISNGDLLGMISRDRIIRYLVTKQELNI